MQRVVSKKGKVIDCRINMTVDEFKEPVYFLLRSDVHHDSTHCDEKMEKKHLEEAKEKGALIMTVGDLFDIMQGRGDKRRSYSELKKTYKDTAYLNSVLEESIEYYKPYSKDFLMISEGNHETSVIKFDGFNMTRELIRALNNETDSNIQYGNYEGYVRITLGRTNESGLNTGKTTETHSFIIYYNHGTGGDAPMTEGLLTAKRRQLWVADADLFVSGNNHNSWIVDGVREKVSRYNDVYYKEFTHVNLPSYKYRTLDGSGWEVETGKAPKPIGAYWLELYVNHTTKKLEYNIQRAK